MHTTLDILEVPCPEHPAPTQPLSTTIGTAGYEGFWAASVTWGEVVEVDRIAANPINYVDPSGEACYGMFFLRAPVTMSFGVGMKDKGFAIEYIPPSNMYKPDDIKLVQAIDTKNVPLTSGGGSSGVHGPHLDVHENGLTATGAIYSGVNRYAWGADPTGTHTTGDFWTWKLPGYLDGGGGKLGVPAGWNSTAYSDLPGADKPDPYDFPIETAAVVKATGLIVGTVKFVFNSGTGLVSVPGATKARNGDLGISASESGDEFLSAQKDWYLYEGKH